MNALREALYRWMPASTPDKRHEADPAQDSSPLKALTDLFGTSARLGDLLDGFLSNARDDLTSFDEAVQTEQVSAIAGCIHRIGGAIKIFGAAALADEGERIRAALLERGQLHGQETALRNYRQELANLIDAMQRHRAALDTSPDTVAH